MKAIIILSFSTIAQAVFSQQQQQQAPQRVFITNNMSNVNVLNNVLLTNVQTNFSNQQKQQVVTNVARVAPVRRYTQVRAVSTTNNPVSRVRRSARPRTASTTPQVVVSPQTVNVINTPVNNQLLNAGNVKTPLQNFILPNNLGNGFDLQNQQGIANVANEDNNLFVQQKSSIDAVPLQINTNVDVSFNLKSRSVARSASSSSSHSRSRTFSKKVAKFKRHFFGKLASHKKNNGHIDLCFNWK